MRMKRAPIGLAYAWAVVLGRACPRCGAMLTGDEPGDAYTTMSVDQMTAMLQNEDWRDFNDAITDEYRAHGRFFCDCRYNR